MTETNDLEYIENQLERIAVALERGHAQAEAGEEVAGSLTERTKTLARLPECSIVKSGSLYYQKKSSVWVRPGSLSTMNNADLAAARSTITVIHVPSGS